VITVDFKWSSKSQAWLNNAGRLLEEAVRNSASGIRSHIDEYVTSVQTTAPRSPTSGPHMADDWFVDYVNVGLGEGTFLSARVRSGESQPAIESHGGETEFNIPWGIHDKFQEHKVWIYLPPGVKGGPRVRDKLAELVLKGQYSPGMDWEQVAHMLREANRKPFIHVKSPATQYAFGGSGKPFLNTLGDAILNEVWANFKQGWES